MTVTEFALIMIGAFYAFAGWVATRAALASLFMDRAIASISGQKPNASEMAQSYWLIAAANLILAGGVALVLRMNVALWLFLASAIGQAFYLYYLAPRIFDREDPPDAVGRAQTRNAFVLYLAATAFVVWAASRGALCCSSVHRLLDGSSWFNEDVKASAQALRAGTDPVERA